MRKEVVVQTIVTGVQSPSFWGSPVEEIAAIRHKVEARET